MFIVFLFSSAFFLSGIETYFAWNTCVFTERLTIYFISLICNVADKHKARHKDLHQYKSNEVSKVNLSN